MLRKYLAQAVALVLIGLPAASAAQKKPLSLDEAISLGIAASPALHASRMRAESSAARTREVAAEKLPSLRLSGGYARLSEVPPFEVTLPISPTPIVVSRNFFDNWSLRLHVEQPLFTGFRLQAGEESARMLEGSAGMDLEEARSEFVFAVKSAYWGLARAREFESVVGESIRQVQEHLKDVRAFFEQGLLTKNEVLRTQIQLANAELLAIDARNAVEVARTSLNSLIGLPVETDVDLTTSAESLSSRGPGPGPSGGPGPAGENPQVEEALARRPDVKSADFRIRASEAGLKAAKSGWYPQVGLFGNYFALSPNPRLMPAQDKFYGTWDLGVSVAIDIWNWGQTKSRTEQARALADQARDARKLLEDRVVLEVIQSRLALVQAGDKVKVAGESVGQAEENLRMVREQFQQGLALNADVMDAEVFLLETRIARTRAAIDFVLAQARLEKALGY